MWKRILTAVLAIALLALVVGQSRKPRYGRTERYYAEEVRPVASKIWVSTTGDMNAAASYSPTGVPIGADSLAFVGEANGGSDISAMLNVTALDDVALTQVHTLPEYPGDLGSAGAHAQIGAGTTDLIHQGSGTWYVGDDYAVAPVMAVDSINAVLAAHIAMTGMTIYARRGFVEVASGVSIELMTNTWRDAPLTVDIKGTTGDLNNCWINGGRIFSGRSQTANRWIHLAGGTWVQDQAGGALTQVSLTGGDLVYNTTGTLSYALLLSGTLDFTQDRRAKTVSNLDILGGEMLDSGNVTVTQLNDMTGVVPLLAQ